ncbi:MAG TPA: hypothetical protein VGC19_11670 [Rhodanobacter sp.]
MNTTAIGQRDRLAAAGYMSARRARKFPLSRRAILPGQLRRLREERSKVGIGWCAANVKVEIETLDEVPAFYGDH